MSKKIFIPSAIISLLILSSFSLTSVTRVYTPDDPKIEYVGRFDFTNPILPRCWAPGAYIKIAFEGKSW